MTTRYERSLVCLARGLALPQMNDGSPSVSNRHHRGARSQRTARQVLEDGILGVAELVAQEHHAHQQVADAFARAARR